MDESVKKKPIYFRIDSDGRQVQVLDQGDIDIIGFQERDDLNPTARSYFIPDDSTEKKEFPPGFENHSGVFVLTGEGNVFQLQVGERRQKASEILPEDIMEGETAIDRDQLQFFEIIHNSISQTQGLLDRPEEWVGEENYLLDLLKNPTTWEDFERRYRSLPVISARMLRDMFGDMASLGVMGKPAYECAKRVAEIYKKINEPRWRDLVVSPDEKKLLNDNIDFTAVRDILGNEEGVVDNIGYPYSGLVQGFFIKLTKRLNLGEKKAFLREVGTPLLKAVAENFMEKKRRPTLKQSTAMSLIQLRDLFSAGTGRLPLEQRIQAWQKITEHLKPEVDLFDEKTAPQFKESVERDLKQFRYERRSLPVSFKLVKSEDWMEDKADSGRKPQGKPIKDPSNPFYALILDYLGAGAKASRVDEIIKEENLVFAIHKGRPIGFSSYKGEGDHLSVKKSFVAEDKRLTGVSEKIILHLIARARSEGKELRADGVPWEIKSRYEKTRDRKREIITKNDAGAIERLPAETIEFRDTEYNHIKDVRVIPHQTPHQKRKLQKN
ncbi:MAG: hypothetical protein ABH950_06455 [Candidatus Altiarchaeota archaeon]